MSETLKELKALTNDQLKERWHGGKFPFEKLDCGTCLTEHASSRIMKWHDPTSCDHDELAREVIAVHRFTGVPTAAELRTHLAKLLRLRIAYKSEYPEAKQ